jgi:hypothetical protein
MKKLNFARRKPDYISNATRDEIAIFEGGGVGCEWVTASTQIGI